MKYLCSILIALFVNKSLFAECKDIQLDIGFSVEVKQAAYQSSPNHGALDEFSIYLNKKAQGYKLDAIELTQGEVLGMIVPIAFTEKGDKVFSQFISSKELAESFELLVTYKNQECYQSYHMNIL